MTTLTMEDAPVEPTSTHAEVTDLAARQHHTAAAPVLTQLVSPATYHLPAVATWDSGLQYPNGARTYGLFGQLRHEDGLDQRQAVGQWADYLGVQVQESHPGWDVDCIEVFAEAVIGDVTVRIWDFIRTPTATTPEA